MTPGYLFFEKDPGARRGRDRSPISEAKQDDATARILRCSVCKQAITDEVHRIEKAGGHLHTFVNPGGFVHEVRCFGVAHGIAEQGDPDTAFSWFPGYSWQILACARCRVHIGWLFRCADDLFYGLIAARLVARSL